MPVNCKVHDDAIQVRGNELSREKIAVEAPIWEITIYPAKMGERYAWIS